MKKINENYFKNHSQNAPDSIDATLTEGEQILWQGKPKKKAYILAAIFKMLPLVLIWLAIDIGAIIGVIASDTKMDTTMIIILCVFIVFHLAPVWIWIVNVVTANRQHKNLEYVFTNQRIIIKSGLIGIDFTNIYYSDIQSVNLKVDLVDKMLKVGDIYIKSSSKSQTLFDIENPYYIVSNLQKIVHDIKTDIEFPNDLRPSTNKGYNPSYTGVNLNDNNSNTDTNTDNQN